MSRHATLLGAERCLTRQNRLRGRLHQCESTTEEDFIQMVTMQEFVHRLKETPSFTLAVKGVTSVNLKKAGMASRNIVMKKQYTLLWSALKWSERGNLPTIQLCHRRSLSTIPPLLSTKKRKSDLTKSIGQQYINDVYAVPEFHFQSQLELYPF